MSVDSKRMLKLETEVKELKDYINKIVGAVKSESNFQSLSLQKSVDEIKVYNKVKESELKAHLNKLKKELESDTDRKINCNNKEITIKPKVPKMQLKGMPAVDIKSEIKSVVTKEYINAIYRNK
tara:strand:- start:841 stop:1212 length:372 start_codon:yes stop_codon:yes gene_type:complete